MKFIEKVDKNKYQSFLNKCEYKNFLQSYEWGSFCEVGKGKKPYYFGVENDKGDLIASVMMIKTNLLFGYSYMYAPRGFILDYSNKELIKFFSDELKNYFKKHKILYMVINPAIMYQELDNNANIIENGKNNYDLYNYLLSIGYKHKGFNKNYESMEPRYTFVIPFENKSFDEVYNGFNKSMRQNIKRAEDLGVEVVKGSIKDIDIFYNLISKTGSRDDFHPYSKEYYENFYKIFNKEGKAEVFISYIYPKKILKGIELLKEQNKNKPKSLEKLQVMEAKYKDIKEDKIPVNAHIIVLDNGLATALYAGNDTEYKDTYSNYLTYYTKIKYAYDNKCKEMDLFGVTGDPNTKYKNLAGIFEFKKQFGGNLIEYIGDFELIANPFLKKIFTFLLKIYHFIRRG